MADVDTSIYGRIANPMDTAKGVFGLLNTAQQNQLLQTANQQRMLELQQSQANDLRSTASSLINTPGLSQAQLKAAIADRARQLNINPASPIIGTMLQRYSGSNWKDNLKLDATSAIGVPGITARTPTIDKTGAGSSVPETAVIGQPLPTSLGPAATAAAGAAGGAAGALVGGEQTANADYRRQVTPLEQAIPELERLGKTGTGPGTAELNQIKSFLQSLGIPGFDPDKITNYDKANKYLTDWVRQNGDVTTNDKLAASFSSSPSTHISNAAAVDVAKTALALRRMKYMQLRQFQESGLTPDQYPAWAAKWNAQHDPRAFGFDQMTVPQRKAVLKTVTNIDQFKQDVQDAKAAGVLNRIQ